MDPLQTDTWREIFYDLIDEVKPENEWELKMVQGLTAEALPWDWTEVVEEHGLASFCCSHCEHVWNSAQAVIHHVHLDHTGAGGQVRKRTFRQQCHLCWVWAEPVFSQDSARRILSDLVTSIRQKFCERLAGDAWLVNDFY
ncbi:PREDICTED: receptor-transporting protein 4-like [Nipponia nippon]|uniref:receptor-transporting protein 4-like n=1 Tax=Nipponia nippon TaxID=128390 RepID=UPI00051169F0|nr:PREDICTED: receptor-transporting protein 4-like [Nipponia nippon]